MFMQTSLVKENEPYGTTIRSIDPTMDRIPILIGYIITVKPNGH